MSKCGEKVGVFAICVNASFTLLVRLYWKRKHQCSVIGVVRGYIGVSLKEYSSELKRVDI